jgi:hypothetical protein
MSEFAAGFLAGCFVSFILYTAAFAWLTRRL